MIQLEPLRVADAAEMVQVLGAPELYSYIGGRPPTLGELTEQYRRQVVGRSVDGREEWLNWVVRVDGTAVGYVQATVHEGARAVVAWVIGLPWQGRGYATTAAVELVGLLRARGVRRIEAYIVPGHVGSERVAERIGLTPTGRMSEGEQMWLALPPD
ncbi:MAG TPA: GNAT family N-acetyltransferase [Mycobacteriales bacterium]